MSEATITQLLVRWRAGNEAALEELTPLVYDSLRQIATRHMAKENVSHTLSPTAVVHEAYLRLQHYQSGINDRSHFLAIAAREMRRVLVDHARRRDTQKRGGNDWQRVTLAEDGAAEQSEAVNIIAVDEAMNKLAAMDDRKARVVELLAFGGLTAAEAAAELGISEATVNREWRFARAFLQRELQA